MDAAANLRFGANFGLMRRTKFVLFATSVPRLSIGCAITGIDRDRCFESRRQACRRLFERRFLGGETEPSRAVSARLTGNARRTVTCC
jgi:hypothetical protein